MAYSRGATREDGTYRLQPKVRERLALDFQDPETEVGAAIASAAIVAVPTADTNTEGVVELATNTEARGLSSTSHVVTPLGLGAAIASASELVRVSVNPSNASATAPLLSELLTIPTYDTSGVIVHPFVYFNGNGWNGWKYWMAFTPYPSANSDYENPSIVVSDNGTDWEVPAGLTNPIDPDPGGSEYNSDPCLCVSHDNVMHLFWRQTSGAVGFDIIFHSESTDGVTWSSAVQVHSDDSSVRRLVSPSVIQLPDGTWVMYATDIVPGTRVTLRYTSDSHLGPWSVSPDTVVITGAPAVEWHVEVRYVGGEFHMLAQDGGGSGGNLWAATSTDGINFTAGGAIVPRGVSGSWNASYYKSSFVPTFKDGVFVWDMWIASTAWSSAISTVGRTTVKFDTIDSQIRSYISVSRRHAMDVTAAAQGIPPYYVGDTFRRANDAAGLGTSTGGQTWSNSTGIIGISSNKAYLPSATNSRAYVSAGASDFYVASNLSTPSSQCYIIARAVDGSNYIRFGLNSGNLNLEVITAAAVASTRNVTTYSSGELILALLCSGTTVTPYVNGVAYAPQTISQGSSATIVGLQANNTSVRYSTFVCYPT